MSKKIKKDTFVQGTMIAYLAIIITKVMGALYSIPFYAIIGEEGGVIYSCAYNVYNLFLNISTSGIPVAVSIIISEYNSLRMFKAKEKTNRVATKAVFLFSVFAFLIMFIFAESIGRFFMTDSGGGVSGSDMAIAIRTVSFCLLVIPFLSMKRGYLQGHEFISISSYSQVIEQFVRIFVVLVGSYLVINVLGMNITLGVAAALSGALVGGAAALWYLSRKISKNREVFDTADGPLDNRNVSTKTILKKILKCCIPIIIVSIASNLYDLTDMKLVMMGLEQLHFPGAESQIIASVKATWAPKICMIINSLAIGLSSSVVPYIVSSYVKKRKREVNKKFNHAINTVIIVTVPCAIGIMMLSHEVYYAFYGESAYGGPILALQVIINVISSITMVASMALQSINRAKLVCVTTVIGLLINAALDLPFMYLFSFLGWEPYLGASVASIIGYSISLYIMFRNLKHTMKFRYTSIYRLLLRMAIPLVAMIAVVWLLGFVLPGTSNGYFMLIVSLAVYGTVGAAVYLFLCYKIGCLQDVFGDGVDKILIKFHLKKKKN